MRRRIDGIRLWVQLAYTILTNGYAYGYLSGKIYQGKLKYVCVPGLNCYSCPGALASCPIGALQALLNRQGYQVPFAALGFFFVFGSVLGRFVCGWLCPFGLLQDLLHRIPLFHKEKHLPHHRLFRKMRILVLVFLVVLGSLFLFDGYAKIPVFCKYLCPSGTFFGALPLLAKSASLRSQIGALFDWKLVLLLALLLLSVKFTRPFCQYLCPLGTIYGWFNRFSLLQIHWERESCVHCDRCEEACPVGLSPEEISVSSQCIRCGRCVKACPRDCLRFQMGRSDSAAEMDVHRSTAGGRTDRRRIYGFHGGTGDAEYLDDLLGGRRQGLSRHDGDCGSGGGCGRDDVESSDATEHMNTWRVAYDLDTVREWLFEQTR